MNCRWSPGVIGCKAVGCARAPAGTAVPTCMGSGQLNKSHTANVTAKVPAVVFQIRITYGYRTRTIRQS